MNLLDIRTPKIPHIQFLQPSLSDGASQTSYIINNYHNLKINLENWQTKDNHCLGISQKCGFDTTLWILKVFTKEIRLARPCIFWKIIKCVRRQCFCYFIWGDNVRKHTAYIWVSYLEQHPGMHKIHCWSNLPYGLWKFMQFLNCNN